MPCTRAASSPTTCWASYSRFEALLGFDDYSRGKGRVDCRVFADGKEIYANPDLRADAPPVKLALPVAGAQQLRLHVDFGRGQDTGDRVIWANARLYRQQAAKVSALRRRLAARNGCELASAERSLMRNTSMEFVAKMHAHEQVHRSIVARRYCRCCVLVAAIGAMAFDDKAQSPVEVYEWSVWVGNPAQPAVNASRIYTNAMPTVVGTSRPKLEEKEAATRFPLSPVSVVQFFGDGGRDIDVDLKVKQGHVPGALAGQQRARRPASVVQVGPVQGPSAPDSPELPAGEPLVPEAARRRLGALSEI